MEKSGTGTRARTSAGTPSERPAERGAERLELAARAAWLYYIAERTQDEIAQLLHISRQTAQRLVALAVAEKLIKFRFDHPIARCMELARQLRERYGLLRCDVVPSNPSRDSLAGIAIAGAQHVEKLLQQPAPTVFALSTGRTLRALAAEISPMQAPHHKLMSLCGTMSLTGRAASLEPVLSIAERTGAQCFPMPTPVVAATAEERELLQTQRAYVQLRALAASARCLLVGVGGIGWMAPLHANGFITDGELSELIEAGAVGEIASRPYDANGRFVDTPVVARLTGLLPDGAAGAERIGLGGGAEKIAAFRGALNGRLLNAIITDEATADAILADHNA